ncbi:alanyl-tRNA synthetase, putative [Trypanosoma equiperdum]|uniref:Alanine--tRNA ligase n=3 Tax=Trypanozoon TaxID=39700 RepID=Q583T3_TRYB2|nr:alanyl-tRNA synthetase, putative [Trypanosoma brucei gambiense DAL972]XP_845193.1 alanyl-tRNA synthetase, putative [Trypanosoma brucei brucei TREU927]AAX80474.1 alanyl-tRNA synthetase, putative [Trypanosoma brucei]SCU65247.1 alanyl-tRNA synthetase, putative [Trypanosoma equiperdum]AAZ11634.1 alanyl-tRNA synthetase, putative [Trypanosoma brucei brucei TREU927]CBH11559.1 alanyl-tRNA synthetase, putative [Trypanosoma brucei gambiense DAL972]|eukprot:XP_011773844.1 alanyl-tRNA synthetase, putative [Trypanosoma brucei gambiense DAL972]
MTKAVTEWPVNRVRQEFVSFFEQRGHTFVPSSAVVPHNDPTLLFTNAGMNQFKNLFLGTADPNTDFGRLTRAVNSQLCIRAGGKHNDLDDVGRDTYHHTFFEMLGSWSFGDYFKREAILWSWELLTEVYKLPKDRLYATYFEGDPANGIEADEESKQLWLQLLPASRVIAGNAKDNFWEMGDVGPCGPCSEIHFDRIGGRDAADLVNKDDPMVLEVWNLVFMQFERRAGGVIVPLPKMHVDTGMGLERLTSILQGADSNYDTDAWTPLFDTIQKVTGFEKSYAEVRHDTCDATVAYRAVADHIRCLTVALADGAMPDSVGRGFVLRRIIRRAVRYGVQFLGAKVGFFHQLVDSVVSSLGPFFKHIQEPRTVQRIKGVLADEETSFARTWETGLKHFNKAVAEAVNNVISGENAFILHDRYGFPVDLTSLLAEKANMSVDLEGFHATMKASQLSSGRVAAAKTFIDVHQLEELKAGGVSPTDDSAKYTWKKHVAEVKAIFDKKSGSFVDVLLPDSEMGPEDIGIILDVTNFYAEAGGQIYDTGCIVAAPDAIFDVRKVYNVGGYIVHVGGMRSVEDGAAAPIPVTASVELQVDYERRLPIAANHTSTHILNWCLRRVLEEEAKDNFMEVNQKGSLVTPEMLRFDFSYNNKVSLEDLIKVEKLINQIIQQGLEVYRKEIALDAASRIAGLRHMFGEKYPDPVSVISVGVPVEKLIAEPESEEWRAYSTEFCGGTHLSNTQDAQLAVILSEESLMKGIRRMVVATRDAARKAQEGGKALQQEYREIMSRPASDAVAKSLSVLNKKVGDSAIPLVVKNTLREEIDGSIKNVLGALKAQAAQMKEKATEAGRAAAEAYDASAGPLLVRHLTDTGADREALQAYADGFSKAVSGDVGLFLVGSDESKALALVSLPPAFVAKKLDAVSWAKTAVGKGGGKPSAAQSGFPAANTTQVLQKAEVEAAKMMAVLLN